jgi:CubicO group peptidase (beta-lactamase class C family)
MKYKNLLIIISFLLVCFKSLSISAEEKKTGPMNIEELKKSLAKIIDDYDIPAVGIAMVDQNGPVWTGALGKANIEKNIDADENTLFRIASTSKMFVALSVLKLMEEGKLTLNDKLTDLAPEIAFRNQWEETNPIRLVHLLEHTTGWDETHYPEFGHNDPTLAALKQGLDFHPHSRQSRWVPGTRFSYTNSGPGVAAYIVEKVTGQSFEDYVQQHFFDPLGMTSTTFLLSETVKRRGATLYGQDKKPLEYSHLIMRPSGAMNASARDMAKLAEFFIHRGRGNGNRILSENSLDRMERVESTSGAKAGQETGYGLNNYSSPHKQWVYRGHDGGFDGAMSEFAYLPEAKLGHAIMINSKNVLAFKKLSMLLRDYETRDLPDKVVETQQMITDRHREIEGFYYPINPRLQMFAFIERLLNMKTLSFDAEALIQRGPLGGKPSYYYPVSTSLYKSKNNGLISLSRVVDPLAEEVIHVAEANGATNNMVLKRINGWIGYSQLIIAILWILIVVTSFAYFLVWFVRKLFGKIPSGATIRVRLWPLLASVSVLLTFILLRIASRDAYSYMSKPTIVSIGVMMTTIALAVFSLIAVITVYRERGAEMNRMNYRYSVCSSVIHLIVTLYLAYFGVIGIMFWT